jgi:N-acetylglucosaminyldiphosphoundecaprenol N-acetyl-beta-D-mannosaminyltransferase
MIKNYPLGHVKICSGDINDVMEFFTKRISDQKETYCMPLNLTKYVISKKDPKLQEVIRSADLVISDGISIVWLSRRAGYEDVYHVPGIDLAEKILSQSREQGWRMFFLGASPENLHMAIHNARERFNNPYIAGFHHGYFKQYEIEKIIEQINSSKPDVLLLGLGMPQKEYFIHDYFRQIRVALCLPVGGAFDVWAEVKKRIPKMIQRVGLEWLFRSFYDKRKALNITRYSLIFLKDFLVYKK